MSHLHPRHPAAGFTLIEVMIAMFILAIGLLGLAGLQARAVNAEADSYARGQALFLVNDLVDRMMANTPEIMPRDAAGALQATGADEFYNLSSNTSAVALDPPASAPTPVTDACVSNASPAACCALKTAGSARDLCEWSLALSGMANSSSMVGAMPSIRGCVFLVSAPTTAPFYREYQIDVVWQGRDVGAAVPAGVTCGAADIPVRRVGVSRRIRFADLGS